MEVRVLLLSLIFSFNIEVNWTEEKCGQPLGVIATAKIVGGFDIGYYKYSWFVSLVRQDTPYCGGTLVTSRHIVTAAHCFKSFIKLGKPEQSNLESVFGIQLGVYNTCRAENTQKWFKANKVNIHERYMRDQPYFDIALITLTEEAKGFQPCCLPTRELHSETRPKEGLIQGLGDQKYQTTVQTCTMHEARVLIYHDNTCKEMLDSVENNGSALIHAFCAGYLQGGIDACQGDSGGPLIILGENSRFILQGITSYGFDCAAPNVLGIYTDVSHFLKWIETKTGRQISNSTEESTSSETIALNTTTSQSPQNITESHSVSTESQPSPEVSYGDNLTTTTIITTQSLTEASTPEITSPNPSAQPATTIKYPTSVNWSIYPASPWTPVTITYVPYQTTPPPHKKKKKKHPQTVIIINVGRSKNESRIVEKRNHKRRPNYHDKVQECGLATRNPTSERIIGGEYVPNHQSPWIAYIKVLRFTYN